MLAVLLLLIASPLGARGVPAQSNVLGSITGFITAVGSTGVSQQGDDSPTTYYLREQGSGTTFRLVFCDEVTSKFDVPLASIVTVALEKIVDGVVYSCAVPIKPVATAATQGRRTRRALLGETIISPLAPRILVFVPSFCGYQAPPHIKKLTSEDVTDLFLYGRNTFQNRSLAGYFNTCSYGQVRLLPENVKVLGGVEVPCNGTLAKKIFGSGSYFTSTACDENDNLPKWQFWLADWAKKTHGVNAADYHHWLLILPGTFLGVMKGCNGAAGLASPGRWSADKTAVNDWGYSLVWWAGENFGDLEIVLHELGHTYGMGHASVQGGCRFGDQCDHTCTMGAMGGQSIRCLNAPHNWQLGWGRPLLQLNDGSLPYGRAVSVQLPPYLLTPNNSVAVSGAGLAPGQRLFITSRTNVYPYDLPYEKSKDGKTFLVMHTYDGSDRDPWRVTTFRGEIGVHETWRDNASALAIRFDAVWENGAVAVSTNGGAAAATATAGGTVFARICRRKADIEQDCGDGLDDDCDFLSDYHDPDCAGRDMPTAPPSPPSPRPLMPPSPPAPPRPPPPPRPPRPPPRPPSPPKPSPPPSPSAPPSPPASPPASPLPSPRRPPPSRSPPPKRSWPPPSPPPPGSLSSLPPSSQSPNPSSSTSGSSGATKNAARTPRTVARAPTPPSPKRS